MDNDKYIGRLLDGRYEILEVIGTGGMAVVYKARCHRLNRMVAIKILKDEYSQDDEFRRRFHAESQAVAMLSHPNIVSIYDVSTSDDADYIVMELIDGISLKQYMEKKGILNWKETLHFAIQIAKALEHAHSRGIIHRDIKPHNVMVLKNGSVKVADFGIARVMSKSNTLTKEALGSVHYISPEQAKGGRVDNRSDLYSLGVVMYEMMTGRPPYDGESPVAIAIQHINGKPQMPSMLNPNIPGGLEQIIMRAMAQSPADRYPTATAMLYDMDEFRKDPTILFDYNNESTELDDATRIQSTARPAEAPAPQTVAEKTAGSRTGSTASRQPARRPNPASQPPRRRREEEIIEDDDEKSGKVATVAVILCAVVAVLAIAIFAVAVGRNILFPQTNDLIPVPNLLNMTESELKEVEYVVVRIGDRQYSSEYEAGRVIEQNPAPNERVQKGSRVTVVISLGEEPKAKTMKDLVGDVKLEDAKSYLEGQNMNLEILPRYENSATIPEGFIIKTEPAAGEELTVGQTVYLWISTGPEIRMEKVPTVTNLSLETALKLLSSYGFDNVDVEEVDSDEKKGTVIQQSITSQEKVDVNTLVVLSVSNGTGGSQGSDEEPTFPTEPEGYVKKIVTVGLPEEIFKDYTLSIWYDGEMLEEREIPKGTISTQFELSGKGIMRFELKIDGGNSWTLDVDFDVVEPEETRETGKTNE
ncbi:MAG: Stk1 family PASTA domain-containing Ser/Thr kinase [Faecousia sp.]